jgi:hypothetical protein
MNEGDQEEPEPPEDWFPENREGRRQKAAVDGDREARLQAIQARKLAPLHRMAGTRDRSARNAAKRRRKAPV